jgi:hypothetical protein
MGQGKKTKTLNVVDVAYCTGMNVEILNWPRPPWERDKGRVKRSGSNQPIVVVIHTRRKQNKESPYVKRHAKMPCFSNYVLCFFYPTKLENRRAKWGD